MIKRQLWGFFLRWALSSFGMFLCINWFGNKAEDISFWIYFLAGFVFSVLNAILRPFVTVFALPLMIITMGLFSVIINTIVVLVTIKIVPSVSMDFWGAFWSSLIMSLTNGLVNLWVTPYNKR